MAPPMKLVSGHRTKRRLPQEESIKGSGVFNEHPITYPKALN